MEERPEPSPEAKPRVKMIRCGMCQRRVPEEQTRTMSGRQLCFGCLASWYDEDEDE